jgi:hypothetical protein
MTVLKSCPTCGAKTKYCLQKGIPSFKAVQDDEIFTKINQLNKVVKKYKEQVELLEKEIQLLKREKVV